MTVSDQGDSILPRATLHSTIILCPAAASSKTYVLRSVLNERIIKEAALMREEIIEEEAADAPSDDNDDEIRSGATEYGSIISWSSADTSRPSACSTLFSRSFSSEGVSLATVSASHCSRSPMLMDPDEFCTMFKCLCLPTMGAIGFSAASTHHTLSLNAYLTLLI
ncbi:MAGE-domain-containing protein [Mycena venus]|uniref:MAGE-domain-containing protein n=1 Tax=Mycena venus TaxID=2733690 RepID=A0A8H7D485_9AGAR|nr:MAGE-domain-containing protein [Mycena venus]